MFSNLSVLLDMQLVGINVFICYSLQRISLDRFIVPTYYYHSLIHFQPMFHLRINEVFTSKMFEKHLWKSDNLSKKQVDDLRLHLKCPSSTGIFQKFC